MAGLSDVIYTLRKLGTLEVEESGEKVVRDVIGMEQKIILEENVIYDWKLEEEVEGIYTITFKFHQAFRRNNLLNNFSHYQVQRNAEETAILVRVTE